MALIVDVPMAGGVIAKDCYVRVRQLEPMRKRIAVVNDETEPYWHCVAHFSIYGNKEDSELAHPDGTPRGPVLYAPSMRYIAVNIDLDKNVIEAVYNALKEDLTARNITWKEE